MAVFRVVGLAFSEEVGLEVVQEVSGYQREKFCWLREQTELTLSGKSFGISRKNETHVP